MTTREPDGTADDSTGMHDFVEQKTLPLELARAEPGGSLDSDTEPQSELPSVANLDALHAGQVSRTHPLIWAVFAFVALILALMPSFGGSAGIRLGLMVGLVACLGAAAWLWWITRVAGRFSDARALPAWLIIVATVGIGVAYFGVFSPAPVGFVLALYFVSQAHGLRASLAVYVVCAGIQFALASLVIAGAMSDPGLITASQMGWHEQVFGQAIVQSVFLVAFLAARGSRRAVTRSVASLEQAIREAAQREAVLLAARRDLEAALRLGEPGRFTDQVVGSYRLGVVIGRGSMGEVYEGTHVQRGNAAAVKLLRREALTRAEFVRRFLREARAAAALDVPNVVRVLEAGDDTAPIPFIAMERLRGQDLGQLLRERGRLSPDEVVHLVREVGRGADAAHCAGIVHRDLKPQNLFLHRPDGEAACWKVLDFGVSKLHGDACTLTGSGLLGTPAYMAPEQARGLAVDARADIYALGVIAFQGLTGELPYLGSGAHDVLYSIVHVAPPPASQLVEGVPEAVDAVLGTVLAKEPRQRYETAAAFAEALANALDSVKGPTRRRTQ